MSRAQRFTANGAPDAGFQMALMRNLTVAQLRSASPLPEDAQRVVDQAVVRVGLDRLTLVADLLAEGLTYPLADPLGVLELKWDSVSETGGAQRTMNPEARGENQLPDRTGRSVPIYLTTDDFFMGIRTLRASERVGAPLDTSMIEQATRRVNEAIEDAAINGVSFTVGGNAAPGLLTAPNVNTYAYASNEAWDAAGKTGEEVLGDVLAMIDVATGDKRYGPFNLYVPTLYGNALNRDFKANGDKTTLMRLEEIMVGGRNLRVRPTDMMPANRTALVQMTSDVIDVVDGQAPTVIPWTSPSGMTLHWMVMAIMVPRVKTDYSSRSGIVIGNTT